MLSMVRHLSPSRYLYRTYLVSSGDAFSALKAVEFERSIASRLEGEGNNRGGVLLRDGDGDKQGKDAVARGKGYEIVTVPRARRIHQPLYTTPFSSLRCLATCLRYLLPSYPRPSLRCPPTPTASTSATSQTIYTPTSPDLILTNGPATGVLVVLAAFILRFLNLAPRGAEGGLRCVYVESWARVGGLSLSGRILEGLGLTERFLVQWEKGLDGVEGREEVVVGKDGEVVGKRKGSREWRGFLVA